MNDLTLLYDMNTYLLYVHDSFSGANMHNNMLLFLCSSLYALVFFVMNPFEQSFDAFRDVSY